MTRPLRIEFAGALYHVTPRGDGREDIFFEDDDRNLWLDVLGQFCERYNWGIHDYWLEASVNLMASTLSASTGFISE